VYAKASSAPACAGCGGAGAWDYKGGLPAITVALSNLLVAGGEQRFTVPATFFFPPAATSPVARATTLQLLGRFLSQLSTNVTLIGLGPNTNNAGSISSASQRSSDSAISRVTLPVPSTMAKSTTRRNRRPAMRGVPRQRRARRAP
jgi:hypothetical protein